MEVLTNLYRVFNGNIRFEVKKIFVPVAKQSIFGNFLSECVVSIYKSKLITDRCCKLTFSKAESHKYFFVTIFYILYIKTLVHHS